MDIIFMREFRESLFSKKGLKSYILIMRKEIFMQRKKMKWIALIVFLVLYLLGVFYFQQRFLPHTKINEQSVTGKTTKEVMNQLKKNTKEKKVKLFFEDGGAEFIYGNKIQINQEVTQTHIQKVKESQNAFLWLPSMFSKTTSFEVKTLDQKSRKNIQKQIKQLKHFKNQRKAKNAYVSYSRANNSYYIEKEKNGTQIEEQKLIELIMNCFSKTTNQIELKPGKGYKKPEICSNNKKLLDQKKKADRYCACRIEYEGTDVVLDGKETLSWLTEQKNGYSYKEDIFHEKAKQFLYEKLSPKVNNVGRKRTFLSATGRKVTVVGGNFGRMVDIEKETAALQKEIKNHTTGKRTYINAGYQKTDENGGFGKNFVEIDMTNQRVYLHENGKVTLSSDCVTGKYVDKERRTPPGSYYIYFKDRNRTLRGSKKEYSSFVKYWMAFNLGIGLHDASWRSSFGGNIYLYSGSHGCINLPESAARTLYGKIKVGTPVVCYY